MTATWQDVARKDFEDAVRSKMVWGLIAVFVGFTSFLILVINATRDVSNAEPLGALSFVAQFAQLFVPLVALIAGYMAIVGEQRSGSLRMLLNYPFSRRDVVAGKLLGRTAVNAVALGVGFALSSLVVIALIGVPSLEKFLILTGFVVLLGTAFTGIAVGVSAATKTRGKAMAGAIGLFIVFFIAWDGIAGGLYYAATGGLPGLEVESWYFLFQQLNPINAYIELVNGAVEDPIGGMVQLPVNDIPADTPPEQRTMAARLIGDTPFYLKDWFNGVILAAWALVPPVLGYLRFRGSDLN
jgi:ABC-2 type transport system permease protein